MPAEEFYQVHTTNLNRPLMSPTLPLGNLPLHLLLANPPPEGFLDASSFLPTSANSWVIWPSRSSKSPMAPPDPPLHPNGLSIPIPQTLTPRFRPLTLPQVIEPLQIPLQTLIWLTLSHVKPVPLMTPP